jgi:chromate transporter
MVCLKHKISDRLALSEFGCLLIFNSASPSRIFLFIYDQAVTRHRDNAAMSPHPDDRRAQPESLTDLFVSFSLLALQGFGGVLAVVQRELVEKKRWMTREEFVEEWAVAQIMPGPNVVNLSLMIGARYFGLKGAMAALAGMLTAPLVVVLLLAMVYAQFTDHPGVQGALRGMGAVAAGLIAATGLKLFGALQKKRAGFAAVHHAWRVVLYRHCPAALAAGLCLAGPGRAGLCNCP